MKFWILGVLLFGIILLSTNVFSYISPACDSCVTGCQQEGSLTFDECLCECAPTCPLNSCCDNGVCDEEKGENYGNCSVDCTTPPAGLNCNSNQIILDGNCFPPTPTTILNSDTKAITPFVFGTMKIKGTTQELNSGNSKNSKLIIPITSETYDLSFNPYSLNDTKLFIIIPNPRDRNYLVDYYNYFNIYFTFFNSITNQDININTPFKLYK